MRYLKYLVLLGLIAIPMTSTQAQISVGIGIGAGPIYYGPPPECQYGYYGFYPYDCAPYGYYEPDYFYNGLFIGAGPWFHGFYGRPFYGRVWDRHSRDFREFREPGWRDDRWLRDDRRFRGNDRGFRDDRGFRGNDRGFRGDNRGFGGGRDFRGGGDNRGNGGFNRGGGQQRGGSGFQGGGGGQQGGSGGGSRGNGGHGGHR